MTKNKLQSITNQQFLKELEQRLPDFTHGEFTILTSLFIKYRAGITKVIQETNPQIHHWMTEKVQEYEQEQTDKEVAELKKSLENNKK